jgi:hypothetical protein
MAITFPVGLTEFSLAFNIQESVLDIMEAVDSQGIRSGVIWRNQIAFPVWTARIKLGPLEAGDAARARTMARRIGMIGSFMVCDTERRWPRLDPQAAIIGPASPIINNISGRSIRLSGMTNSYRLTTGDLFHVLAGGGRRILLEVAEDVEASNAGTTPFFDVNPFIPTSVSIGQSVTFFRPHTKMMFVDRNIGNTIGELTFDFEFNAIQDLR